MEAFDLSDDKRLQDIERQLKTIPRKPGVYIIYDKRDEIIYIGKAKILNNRLRSHFTKSNDFSKSRVIRERGVKIEIHEVSSENEALLLEFNLIQEHQPPLNDKWKDGKTYPYLEVTTGEEFPRFEFTRERTNKESIFLGPYSNLGSARRSLKYVLSMFPVADCHKEIHLGDASGWAKTCIRRRTRQCLRPCEIEVNVKDYRDQVDQVIKFLEGKVPQIAESIEKTMKVHSDNLEFEKAAKDRDLLKSIHRTMERQRVMIEGVEDVIVIADARNRRESCVALQKIVNGNVIRQESQAIERDELEEASWGDFVLNFLLNILTLYDKPSVNRKTDKEVKSIIIKTVKSKEIIPRLEEFGFDIRESETEIDKQLVQMTKTHAKKILQRRALLRKEKGLPTTRVSDLQKVLQMEFPPFIIDTFDVSTLMGTHNVASCIRFVNGRPLKKGYRRFKIRTVEGQDDFASMEEVVFRRYRDVKDGFDPKGLPTPDLVVIDGGLEQLKRATLSLQKIGLSIPTIGLAKKFEEIYQLEHERPLQENKMRPGLLLLRSCRDEAHRFAITYHRKLRQKENLRSLLDNIHGVGVKTRIKLLNRYGSISIIAKQSSETLARQLRMNPKLASRIISNCRKYITNDSDNRR